MSISFSYHERDVQEAHGSQPIESGTDFSSYKEMKKAVSALFDNYKCPNCGGHKMVGSGVIVEIGKVKLFEEELKKGWFGGKKYVDRHIKDVWRIYDIRLETGGLFNLIPPAGTLECKSCRWKVKGDKSTRWLSANDVLKGNF